MMTNTSNKMEIQIHSCSLGVEFFKLCCWKKCYYIFIHYKLTTINCNIMYKTFCHPVKNLDEGNAFQLFYEKSFTKF